MALLCNDSCRGKAFKAVTNRANKSVTWVYGSRRRHACEKISTPHSKKKCIVESTTVKIKMNAFYSFYTPFYRKNPTQPTNSSLVPPSPYPSMHVSDCCRDMREKRKVGQAAWTGSQGAGQLSISAQQILQQNVFELHRGQGCENRFSHSQMCIAGQLLL